ncbi:thioredoxin-disulfide reductase [Candidatus Dojkabacteria bacterium]|nr:thioredoxin-disulfide reductase [Candidatus Dojkabacteria bacterium]
MEKVQVAIIGSGPAGLTAAIYAARAGLEPVIFAGTNIGGQLMQTTLVENYPGFAEGVQGPELMKNMLDQAKNMGAEVKYAVVSEVSFEKRPFYLKAGENEYEAESVIIATGAVPKRLGLESETKFWGKGVSSCATCDGAFYKDKVVAVVGGGSVAFEDAIYLTNHAQKVYLIHRREEFRAERILVDQAKASDKIEFVLNAEVEEILGDQKVAGVKLKRSEAAVGELEHKELDVEGVFVAIGYIPTTEVFKGQVEMDEAGYIKKYEDSKTNVEGVFVAGDAEDFKYRQAITAAGDGCRAAMDLDVWLRANQQ